MTFPVILRPHQVEATQQLLNNTKGQVIVPTAGGKTLIAISDAYREFQSDSPKTIVVCAPRILLASQLCSEFLEVIDNANVIHVHSGETKHFSTTKPEKIKLAVDMCKTVGIHTLIFTTYHSLHRVQESGIEVDTIYFDEAHNSVRRDFFPPTEYFSQEAKRCYFFTATPKHSVTIAKPGMNDASVYGNVIMNVPAPKLVEGGFIVPPKVHVKELEMVQKGQHVAERDCENLLDSIDDHQVDKVLVCAKAVKQIINLVSQTDFATQLQERGYSYLYISAKTGGVIDGVKVTREKFFETLNSWGRDNDKKFVVLHHSILSEGINVSGLNAVIFMRNMDYIGLSQTIGRVIRMHQDDAKGIKEGSISAGDTNSYTKSFGLCIVPVFSKVGIQTAKSLQTVVNTIFEEGEPAVSVVRR